MCPRTGQETASQVRSFSAKLACSMHSFNENKHASCCCCWFFADRFYAAHCRLAGPVRAKYGSDSEFFDLDVSSWPLTSLCAITGCIPFVLSCVAFGDAAAATDGVERTASLRNCNMEW